MLKFRQGLKKKKMRRLLVIIGFVSVLRAADPAEFFEMKVRPVLANKCYACHSNSRMGGLDLTSRASVLKGGNSGASIVPNQPDQSLLIQAVEQTHAKIKMPPGGKLPDNEVADLKAWVAGGAIWPEKAVLKAGACRCGWARITPITRSATVPILRKLER